MSPSTDPPRPPSGSPLGVADAVGMAVLSIALLLIGYFRSRHCMFWADEIMGMLILRQPNFAGVLRLWHAGVDSSGIWFYVLGRPWLWIFGLSEMSLRLFSASGVALSAVVLWATARRYYALLPVAASITVVYLSTVALRWQLSNGRTYGLFVSGCALALYMLFRGEDEDQWRPGTLFLLATFAVHALLTGSHILGVLYSGVFFCMQGILDLAARRFRPLLYLSIAASWVVFLFSLPNIRATSNLGKPTFWTLPPTMHQLVSGAIVLQRPVIAAIAVLFCLTALHLRYRRPRKPMYLLFAGFAVLDLFLFVLSRHGTSIYVDRYLLPFSLVAVLMLCELMEQIRETGEPYRWVRQVLPAAILAAAIFHSVRPKVETRWPLPYPDFTAGLVAHLPPGLPVVDADTGSFLQMEYYTRDSGGHRLIFPDDRNVALNPVNASNVSGFNSVDNFRYVGLYPGDVQSTAEIMAQPGPFLVISDMSDHNLWFQQNVAANPAFIETRLEVPVQSLFPFDVWLVQRR